MRERSDTETALRKAKEEYRLLAEELRFHLENPPLAAVEFAADYTVTRWSKQAEKLFGWTAKEIVGRRISDIHWVYEEDQEKVAKVSVEMAAGGSLRNVNRNRNYRKDGSLVYCEWYNSARVDAEGKLVSVFSLVLDVTERTQAELRQRQTEERYRLAAAHAERERAQLEAVFDSVSDGIMVFDMSGKAILINEAEARIAGFPSAEAMHRNLASFREIFELRTPDGNPLKPDQWPVARVLRGESLADWEVRGRRRDTGQEWVFSYTGEPVRDANGTQILAVVITRDITERMRVQEELRASEERQRLAAEAGNIGLWDWDIEKNRVVWSDRVYQFHGLAPEEFDGSVQAFSQLIHPEDRERVAQAIDAAIKHGKPYAIEFRTVRPNGEVRWLTTRAGVIFDARGQAVRMLGATLDSTERREAEEALRRTNSELEEFAYVASHDLQEPLRMVNIYAEKLVRKYADAANREARDYAEYIGQGVTRMDELIRDLLSYSRTIRADLRTHRTVDLSDVVSRALAVLRPQITETSAAVDAAGLPAVCGDANQLVHVFQNLLSNSLKYRSEQPPRIAIAAERKDRCWVISVRDNGIGFDPQYADRIFGLFKRLYADEYPGTGLGLAICKRIIERHGGRIWAESKAHEGATFYFSLPEAR